MTGSPLTPSTKPCNVEHLANERPVTRSRDASLPIRGQDSDLHVDKDVKTQLSQVSSCHEDKDEKMDTMRVENEILTKKLENLEENLALCENKGVVPSISRSTSNLLINELLS